MNQSQPNSSPSPQRFEAELAFFESLEDLDDLMGDGISPQDPCEKNNLSSESSDEKINFSHWDEIEEDLEKALAELLDQESNPE